MELILKILNELAALVILVNFVICAGILWLTFKRVRHVYFRKSKRLIRCALIIGVSIFAMFSSLSNNHLSPFSMTIFGAAALMPTFYGMLFFQNDDSREKKDKTRKRLFRLIFLISFILGAVPALFESGMEGKLMSLLFVLIGAFIACGVLWAFTINLSEDDYCTQCGYYAGIECIKEDVLDREVTQWDSEEWTETKRGDKVVSKSPTQHFRNTRVQELVLMHLRCEHCGHEYEKQEERDHTAKIHK